MTKMLVGLSFQGFAGCPMGNLRTPTFPHHEPNRLEHGGFFNQEILRLQV